MSDTTKIQWADATFNPWIGCAKVSAGCKNCYAENTTRARVLRSQGHETWGKGAARSRTSEATWRQPLKWNNQSPDKCLEGRAIRQRIFPSLCDWLDDEVPIQWLADFLKLIHDTPNLDWLLLTKRPENFHRRLLEAISIEMHEEHAQAGIVHADGTPDWALCVASWAGTIKGLKVEPFPNVWLGTSVENQEMADKRIPELLKIPATVRFISAEPLLGLVDFRLSENVNRNIETSQFGPWLHWIIVGGESGPHARPCNVEWIRSIVRQCRIAECPVFVKQLGSHSCVGREDSQIIRDKKGGNMEEWPHDIRIRQFPNLKKA